MPGAASAPCTAPRASVSPIGALAKDRRPCRFAPLNDHTVVASRLGFTDAAVLRAAPDFLVGIGALRVPAGYEPLDECFRLAAGRARGMRHRRDGDSQGAVESCEIGERWYMDWTRMFESSHDGNKFGLVFVEAKTWLLRVRFFRDKSALSLVEGIAWLREFVRTNALDRSVRELHGDSDTSWTVSGRGRDLNTAVVESYVRGIDPPFRIVRCPPGTQSMNMAERGQKRLLMLANLNLHHGRLSLLAWDDMFLAAEGQLDHHPMAKAEDPRLRAECRYTNFFGTRPDASKWIAQPGQSVYFLVADRKMTSGDDMTEAGYFVRPCEESKGWVVRSLRTRKLVVTRNVYVVKDANTRHAQLALSDDLVARHGSLDTAPDDYRDSVRKLFAARLDLPVSSALVIDDPSPASPSPWFPRWTPTMSTCSSPRRRGSRMVLARSPCWPTSSGAPCTATSVAALPCRATFDHRSNACSVCVLPAGLPRTSCPTTSARPSGSPPVRPSRTSCPTTCGTRVAHAPTRTRDAARTASSSASW